MSIPLFATLTVSERNHLQSLVNEHGQAYVCRQLKYQAAQLQALLNPDRQLREGTVLVYRERIKTFDPSIPHPKQGRPKGSGNRQKHYSNQFDNKVISMTYLQLWEHSPSPHLYHQYKQAFDRITPLGTLPFVEWFALVSNGFNLSPDPNETLPARQSKAQDDARYGRPSGNPPLPDSHLPPHIAAKQSEVAFSVEGDFNIQDYMHLLEPTNQTESR